MNSSNINMGDGIIRNLGNHESMVVSRVVRHGGRAVMQYDAYQSRSRGENPLVKHTSEIIKLPDRVKCSAQGYDNMKRQRGPFEPDRPRETYGQATQKSPFTPYNPYALGVPLYPNTPYNSYISIYTI